MSALPVEALEPAPGVAHLLKRWGIRSVGELVALGQEALTARLGLEALALFAAAATTMIRPLQLVCPLEQFEDTFEFEPAVETLQPLLFLLRRFVDQLTQRLDLRAFVAESLVLKLGLESGETLEAQLRIPQPTSRPDVLFRALYTHLETVTTETPIKTVGLAILPRKAEDKQLGLFETVLADPHRFKETLARLSAVVGPDRVGTPLLENSHCPDRFRLAPPDFENAPILVESSKAKEPATAPIRRFRPPLKAEVAGEPAPASVQCAVSQGKLKVVVGPWRVSGNWWEAGGWEREEWDAATSDGKVLRLVRRPEGWFVEGIVD
jgi:protein ImuB